MRIAVAIVLPALATVLGMACSSPRGDAITNRASGSGSQTAAPVALDPLPLPPGATFIYDVTIVFFDASTGQEATAQFPWTMSVVDVKGTHVKLTGWLPQLVDFDAKLPYHAPPPRVTELVKTDGAVSFVDRPWFALPLVDGQRTCPDPQSRYCWQVAADHERFNLSFVTNPDEETFELTPGVGITRYAYRHHGTTMDVTAKLVSHPGG